MNSSSIYHFRLHKLFLTVAIIASSVVLKAQQEPMFTQYVFNESFINPAYAGSHEGLSMNMLYRDQWVGLKGSPKTQTFTMHMPD